MFHREDFVLLTDDIRFYIRSNRGYFSSEAWSRILRLSISLIASFSLGALYEPASAGKRGFRGFRRTSANVRFLWPVRSDRLSTFGSLS